MTIEDSFCGGSNRSLSFHCNSGVTEGQFLPFWSLHRKSFMSIKLNLATGDTVGRLTILSLTASKQGTIASCLCSCGKNHSVLARVIASGRSKSCGCYKAEVSGYANKRHGLSKTKVHNTWTDILNRVQRTSDPRYKDYGGRGITVCDSWRVFENFYRDMGEPPSPHHSIDRIDNSKGYFKNNCKWSTSTEQSRNRRTTVYVMHVDRKISLAEAVELKHEDYRRVWLRLKRYQWTLARALGNEFSWPNGVNPYERKT